MEKLLSIGQVRERVPLSRQEIYRRIKAGSFPRQIPLGPQRVAWREADIEEWILQRIADAQGN